MEPHRVDGRHARRPLHALLGHLELRPGLLEPLQQRPAGLVEGVPLFRGLERAPRAVEQGQIELRLQLLDGLAGRGLGDAIGRGAAREAPEPDHVAVELEGVQVHGPTLSLLDVLM